MKNLACSFISLLQCMNSERNPIKRTEVGVPQQRTDRRTDGLASRKQKSSTFVGGRVCGRGLGVRG